MNERLSPHIHFFRALLLAVFVLLCQATLSYGQREGGLPQGMVVDRLLVSNGPDGPIHGGESAVTDLIFMDDNWVYGGTEATWGAESAHLFRTNGQQIEHLQNLTGRFPGQTAVRDLHKLSGTVIVGATSTGNEQFDDADLHYRGGHLFLYDLERKEIEDLGIVAEGQGIHCITVDQAREIIYGVTYPAGHLFSYDLQEDRIRDFGEVMTQRRVKHLGRVSWRGVPKVLMIDDAGTVYFSTYAREETDEGEEVSTEEGGLIYRLAFGDDQPVFTGARIPVQRGMDTNPIYENGIASAIRARDGGFWAGTINDGFLFKFYPSTSTVVNKGKAFQYWNLKSLAYGGDGTLFMLGGRDYDNTWLMNYDPALGSIESLGWPSPSTQGSVISRGPDGHLLFAENLRHSYIWVLKPKP